MHADDPIYLDHNATTPIADEVREAMEPYLRQHFGNPSSSHVYGRRARRGVDRARQQVAELLGASPSEILFTSGGTEANNLAIRGVCGAFEQPAGVVTSVIEHPAVAHPCDHLEEVGWQITRIEVDGQGQFDLNELEEVPDDTALITLMHSNNETGVLQPIAEAVEMAKSRGAVVHTDAAQSVGKVDIDVDELGVDLLSVAGHKLYAPKGVGALFVRKGTTLAPVLRGASHEQGLRPGTENVASIVGLGAACELVRRNLDDEHRRITELRDRFFEMLGAQIEGLAINGDPERRLPNTLNVRFPEVAAGELLAHTPQVAASAGSACHEGGAQASQTITAMGIAPQEALGSVRLTLGRSTTLDEIEAAADALVDGWRTLTS